MRHWYWFLGMYVFCNLRDRINGYIIIRHDYWDTWAITTTTVDETCILSVTDPRSHSSQNSILDSFFESLHRWQVLQTEHCQGYLRKWTNMEGFKSAHEVWTDRVKWKKTTKQKWKDMLGDHIERVKQNINSQRVRIKT